MATGHEPTTWSSTPWSWPSSTASGSSRSTLVPARDDPRASALNLITPISSRGRLWLRFLFFAATILPLPRLTVLRLRLIHYARWTVLGRSRPHLLFESNFNGIPDAYVEAFSYVFPLGLKLIWGSSERFPGPIPVESLREWIDE